MVSASPFKSEGPTTSGIRAPLRTGSLSKLPPPRLLSHLPFQHLAKPADASASPSETRKTAPSAQSICSDHPALVTPKVVPLHVRIRSAKLTYNKQHDTSRISHAPISAASPPRLALTQPDATPTPKPLVHLSQHIHTPGASKTRGDVPSTLAHHTRQSEAPTVSKFLAQLPQQRHAPGTPEPPAGFAPGASAAPSSLVHMPQQPHAAGTPQNLFGHPNSPLVQAKAPTAPKSLAQLSQQRQTPEWSNGPSLSQIRTAAGPVLPQTPNQPQFQSDARRQGSAFLCCSSRTF